MDKGYSLVLVLGTALAGMNVMLVLVLGIFSTGVIGIVAGGANFFTWVGAIGKGKGRGELIIITLLEGGMLVMIRYNGGITYIIKKMTQHIKGSGGAEISIALLVSIVNLWTANNTIAIITVGPIARDIARKFGLS